MQNTQKRKFVLSLVIGFCFLFLIDWSGITGRRFPRSWSEFVIQVCINIGWVSLFAVVSYFALIRRPKRSENDNGPSAQASGQK